MFDDIQETMKNRNEMVQVHNGIIRTTGKHLLEISVSCGIQN